MKNDTYEALIDLGLSAHFTGFIYVGEAIDMIRASPDGYRQRLVAGLYAELAEKFGTTGVRVERSIRTVIQKSWEATASPLRIKYFSAMGRAGSYNHPTNAEFLHAVASHLTNK